MARGEPRKGRSTGTKAADAAAPAPDLGRALAALDDLFFVLDAEQRHVEIRGRAVERERFLGRTAREVLGDSAALVHEEAVARALQGETVLYDWSMDSPRGPRRLQTSLSPIRDASGRVTGLVGVGRDITDLARAVRQRDALQNLSRQLGGPLDEREVGRLIAATCRLLFAHDAFCLDLLDESGRMTRTLYAEDTPLGAPEPVNVDLKPATISPLASAIRATGEPRLLNRMEEEPAPAVHNPFGFKTRRSRSLMHAPIRWMDQVVGFLSSQSYIPGKYGESDLHLIQAVADLCGGVLARLRIEERLRKSEDDLRQSQKMEAVGRLASGVAHDFNNLITVITGHAGLIRDLLAADSPARVHVQEILAAADKAAGVTRRLLALGRRQILQPRPLDLNDVISSLRPILRSLMGEDIDLELHLEPYLPSILGDPGQVEQILLNLVANAREATAVGGKITVETSPTGPEAAFMARHPDARPGPYVRLAVADTGSGMDAETLSHLFEPYFTTKASGQGAGLGLSTVYGAVQQAGGLIDVRSEVGRGTSVLVYLPGATK